MQEVNRLFKFGFSGAVATLVHVAVLAVLVERVDVSPVPASVLAFCCAVLVSYGLNYKWTFPASGSHEFLLPRFALVATLGLGLNAGITYLVVNVGGMWYGYALLLVVATVPAMTFLLSKYWAFAQNRRRGAAYERAK